ncbi:MAG: DUF2330 domain-containing protein [Myxococcales bacterium]|nr:DUF2330 domain-containing protein [Myxococcales bacterium]
MHRFIAGLALSAGLTAAPAAAFACGGFFCSSAPVDQQAERILFVQEGADTWSTYVEIQYQGDADAFAWVVPVPEVPELDTWYPQAFSALDQATEPQYQPDWSCAPVDFAAEGDGAPNAGGQDPDDDGVQVLAQEQVGPFETATIQSDDPRALVEWLRQNDYRIVPEMEPFIALYTAEGMKFTAMRLSDGETVESIRPIKMTYRSMNPVVPLRLTSVAAMPEMGVKVWILADQKFGPLNVPEIEIPLDEVVFDYNRWQTNYLPLVARKVDEAGGHGFVTEYAQKTDDLAQLIADSFVPERFGEEPVLARDDLARILRSKPYLTRLYTRVSPEEMDLDPLFTGVQGEDVSNIHQLPAPEQCDPQAPNAAGLDGAAEACDFAACGAAGRCADVVAPSYGQTACACAPGAVARMVPDPLLPGRMQVSCVDARLNFTTPTTGAAIGGSPVLTLPDPCTAGLCGDHGECVALNGAPTCRCEQGFVATAQQQDDGMFTVNCVAPAEPVPAAFYQVALREPNLPYPGRVAPVGMASAGGGSTWGCDATGRGTDAGLLALLLGLLPVVRRRRR